MRQAPQSRIRGQKQRGQRILGDCWQWETNGQCVKGDNCSFRHDANKRGKVTPSNPSPNSFMQQNERKASRTRSPRGKSPSGRIFDGLARITSKELAPLHSVRSGTLQDACSTRPRVDADLVKSARMHTVRLMNNLAKGLKEWWQKCSSYVEEEWLARKCMATCCQPWQESREIGATRCKAWHPSRAPGTCWVQIIEYTTIGLRLSGHEAAEAYLTEELRHAEANPTCKIHDSDCASHNNSRPKSFARIHLPRWTSSAQPQRSKIWGSVSGGDRVARLRCPRSSVGSSPKVY